MTCLIVLLNSSIINAKDKEQITSKYIINTVNVDKDYSVKLYDDGCYANATINLNGSYDLNIFPGGKKTYTNIKLKATISNYPSDWKVETYGSPDTLGTDSGLQVIIRYRFVPSYWDCPITGGWVYNAYTAIV